jgi:hypothetical protein
MIILFIRTRLDIGILELIWVSIEFGVSRTIVWLKRNLALSSKVPTAGPYVLDVVWLIIDPPVLEINHLVNLYCMRYCNSFDLKFPVIIRIIVFR